MISTDKYKLNQNIWKLFIYNLTQRRNFIPLLSIIFLTFPNTQIQQIGIYTSAGYFVSFLLEIPSGYFSDKFGQKNTLIIAKLMMIISTISFLFGHSFLFYIIGSILLSSSFALESGTKQVFMHNTLLGLNKEKDYIKLMGKNAANVSFISGILIILLPFFTKINILFPLIIYLVFDIIGFFVAISFKEPREKIESEKINLNSFKTFFNQTKKTSFYSTAIFVGLISGVITTGSYKEIYLTSLGLPLVLVGLVMGLSRFIWFIVGHNSHKISERINFKKLMKIEMFLFPTLLIACAIITNVYILIMLFALMTGYYWGRIQIEDNYFLTHYKLDTEYKATMLSIKAQFSSLFEFVVSLIIGFVMAISFRLGYLVLGVGLFIFLAINYYFIKWDQ